MYNTGYAVGVIVGAIVVGALCGLIPFLYGRKNNENSLAIAGFVVCLIAGFIGGLIFGLIAAAIFYFVIRSKVNKANASGGMADSVMDESYTPYSNDEPVQTVDDFEVVQPAEDVETVQTVENPFEDSASLSDRLDQMRDDK